MVFVNGDGTIIRCYDAVTGATSGNCGFTVLHDSTVIPGAYVVDFGFNVSDRFYSVSAQSAGDVTVNFETFPNFGGATPNKLRVGVNETDGGAPTDRPVMILVF